MDRDQKLLAEVLATHQPRLAATYEIVQARLEAVLESDATVYRDLTYRHAAVLFAALSAFDVDPPHAEHAAAGAVLAYSIPLVWMDSVLDGRGGGSELGPRDPAMALPVLTSAGYLEIARSTRDSVSVAIVAEQAMTIVAAMERDAARRHDDRQLTISEADIEEYWTASSSRLNGSGVSTVMMGLASALALGRPDPDVTATATALGRLRQLADELLDVREDVGAGLVTLPASYALVGEDGERVHALVRRLWESADAAEAARLGDELVSAILASAASVEICRRADQLLSAAEARVRAVFPAPEPVLDLLRQRRFAMDRAIANGLSDAERPLTVADLLGRADASR